MTVSDINALSQGMLPIFLLSIGVILSFAAIFLVCTAKKKEIAGGVMMAAATIFFCLSFGILFDQWKQDSKKCNIQTVQYNFGEMEIQGQQTYDSPPAKDF